MNYQSDLAYSHYSCGSNMKPKIQNKYRYDVYQSVNNYNLLKETIDIDSPQNKHIEKMRDLELNYQQIQKKKEERIQNQLEEFEIQNRELQNRINQLIVINQDQKILIEQKEKEQKRNNQENQRLYESNLENKQYLQSIEESINEMQEEKNQIILQYQQLQHELQEMRIENEVLIKEKNQYQNQENIDKEYIKRYKKEGLQLEEVLEQKIEEQLEVKTQLLKEQLEQKTRMYEKSQQELDKLEKYKNHNEFEQKSKEIEMNGLIKKINQLVQRQNIKEEDERKLILHNNELKEINEQLIGQSRKLVGELDDCQKMIKQMEEKIEQINKNDKTKEIEEQLQMNQQLQDQIECYVREIEEYQQTNQGLQDMIIQNRQQFAEYQKEIDLVERGKQEYQRELRDKSEECNRLKKELEQMKEIQIQQKVKMEEMETQIEDMQIENRRIKQANQKVVNYGNQMKSKLQILMQRLQKIQQI